MPITPAGSATELCNAGSGGGGGAGTVTSITDRWTAIPEILVNGLDADTITTSGTFAHTWVNQGPYEVLASPGDGSVGTPLFRGLVIGDIPDLGSLYWKLTGNAGTSAGTNFLGTTDARDLVFKTQGVEAIRTVVPVGGKSGRVGIGTIGGTPSAQLEVYRDNDIAAVSVPDLWSLRATTLFNKWQTVPYIGASVYVGWYADPAGYSPVPTTTYGGGVDHGFDICTHGTGAGSVPTGQYFEYAGIAVNMNYTAKAGGDATQTSDGQSGGYVYDGHLNKGAYVVVPSTGALKAQLAGNVKLMELGMHNAVAPNRGGAPYTVSDGLQMNLSDKLVSGQPVSGVYDYVRCVPGSPTVTGVGTLPPDRSTVRLNGLPYVVLSSVGTTVTLTTNWAGGMTGPAGTENVHYVYEVGSVVTATNGSPTVSWSSGLTFDSSWKGYQVLLGGAVYIISSVTNSTTLVLTTNFSGTSGTTNANFYSIYVAQQDNALHFQTHSDARNWNAILQHNHGFSTPCDSIVNVRSMISGDGGLFNRFAYVAPYKTTWSPGANWGAAAPVNVGSAIYVTEEYTAEMAGGLFTMYSPVKAAQPFYFVRQDTSAFAGNVFQANLAVDGAGVANGTFTGNFFACYKDGTAGANLKFWVEAQGNVRGRFVDIGPRVDGYVASPANIVSVSDANYAGGTGDMYATTMIRPGAHVGMAIRQDVGAYTGVFIGIQSNTAAPGGVPAQGSGSFSGRYLSFTDFTAATVAQRFYVDYQGRTYYGDVAAPPATPTAGVIVYAEAGSLKAIGSSGTITVLAVA